MNLINLELRGTATLDMQNVVTVTRGGKKTGEDARGKETARVVRPASPKMLIKPEAQKKYFQEAVEAFAQLRDAGGLEEPVLPESGAQSVTGTVIEDWLQLFLRIVDNDALRQQLKHAFEGALQGRTGLRDLVNAGPQYMQRVKRKKQRTGKEFRLNTRVSGFQISDTMLDLGSDVNILPRKTWEALGRPRLAYSPIQLRMANQYCILLIGRLEGVEVDIVGVKTYTDFEVIDIMGDKDPYPTLLGIDWAFDNYAIIDLKKELMIFKDGEVWVT